MKTQVIEYLIDNQDYFKDKYKPLFEQRKVLLDKENGVFHSDIDANFKAVIHSSMTNELSRATGADMETIMIVLEDMNMEMFFT